MIDKYTILKKKTELLCKGVYLDENLINNYKSQGITLDFGRKGGAGPLGGRYFTFEDEETLVNIALWNKKNYTNLKLGKKVNDYFEISDNGGKDPFVKLKLIPYPKYYNLKTSDGILMKKIALMHGKDCVATTVYQKCKYWACGEGCQFCGIELSLDQGTTILEKNAQQITEVISAAKQEGRCSHVTLTSGTTEEDGKGAKRYIDILKGIKKLHPDISLHVQIEPFKDFAYIDQLKEAGADTIGIHVEILDNDIRRKITPGKFKIPYSLFEENWRHALEVFGKNQVETYILTGLGEDTDELIESIEKVVAIGVVPYITPTRPIPEKVSNAPGMNHELLLEIYLKTAKMMKDYKVDPLKNIAGCVRCGGCSAINEAYKAI